MSTLLYLIQKVLLKKPFWPINLFIFAACSPYISFGMHVDESNPWKTLSSEKIYDNPWITVHENQVLNPAGKPGIYGVVHFKNKALAIVPVDEELNTWLVGQYRYSLNEYSWEIPMGGVPENEDLLEGAKRELREETGLSAQKWTYLSRIHTSNSVTDEEGFIYLAQDLTEGNTEFEETEQLAVKKVTLHEAYRMVMNNEITDSLSIAGIMKAAVFFDIHL